MHKAFLKTAAVLGAVSVGLGAFAAHKLKQLVSDIAVNTFETGVRYQFYHTLALALAGILHKEFPNKWVKAAGSFFLIGMLFFSGSLYVLTYKAATVSNGFNWVGPITPVGGIFFIVGWVCLGMGIQKKKTA